MIVPIGRGPSSKCWRPWLTYAILTLCVAVYVTSLPVSNRRLGKAVELLAEAVRFQRQHPQTLLSPGVAAALQEGAGSPPAGSTAADYTALEQVELDGLTRDALSTLRETPQGSWGVAPARLSPLSLLIHPFVHAGAIQLLANLAILFLFAPFLEEVWGRRLFGAVFLLAGAVSGASFAVLHPALELPLVGASGVSAAVVGALVVRCRGRRLFFSAMCPRTRGWILFAVASWVTLPVWLARVAVCRFAGDIVAPAGGGLIGASAQFAGLVFGAAAAALIARFGLEERFADTAARAVAGFPEGKEEGALWPPVRRAGSQPGLGGPPERGASADSEAAGVALRNLLQGGRTLEAHARWRQWERSKSAEPVAPALEVRLAEDLRRAGSRSEAAEVVCCVLARSLHNLSTEAVLKLARMAEGGDQTRAAAAALGRPDLSADVRREVEILAARLPQGPRPAPPDRVPDPVRAAGRGLAGEAASQRPTAGPKVSVKPLLATPVELRADALAVDLDGRGARTVAFNRVRAIAAASVDDGSSAEPNLILDLFLEDPPRQAGEVKVLRIESFRFDPRTFIPTEEDLEDAFLSLAGAILAGSGASWLLGESPRQLPRFRSREAYEHGLSSVLSLSVR